MEKLVITKVKSHVVDDCYPYVRYYERELVPELKPNNGPPTKDWFGHEILHPMTFITSEGKELNICMPREVSKVIGYPLEVLSRMQGELDQLRANEGMKEKRCALLESRLMKLNGLKWYQRLRAVFFKLEIKI